MFEATCEILDDQAHRYTVTSTHEPLSYAEALDLWQHSDAFRSLFNSLLINSPFQAFRWETPPITLANAKRSFEFVLLESPWLSGRPDPHTFAGYFTVDDSDAGVVTFANLGRDSTLVAPSPRAPPSVYTHLGAFMRGAPDVQKDALWSRVGEAAQARLDEKPLWISTHGGGVAWLHVRLDSRPKYYSHAPYMPCPRR